MRRSWTLGMAMGLGMATLVAGRRASADELRAPQNINAESWSRQSAELATRAAKAEMAGQPRQALALAQQGIAANPRDPWPHYDKGMALVRLGQTDLAVAALTEAEQRFSAADRWGRSVAMYGRAYAFGQVGRCAEARQAFEQYATFVESQAPKSAEMARGYAATCRSPATPPVPAPGAQAPGQQPPAESAPGAQAPAGQTP